jgi:hypothetical protein
VLLSAASGGLRIMPNDLDDSSIRVALAVEPNTGGHVAATLTALRNALEGIHQFPVGVVDRLFGLLQVSDGLVDVCSVELNNRTTSGARQLQISVQPSQCLLGLVAATRARDWKRLIALIDKHEMAPQQ